MKLKYVVCSGANEYTDIDGLLSLQKEFPLAEFGFQVSGFKCFKGSPRLDWLHRLRKAAQANRTKPLNVALHLNRDWVEGFSAGWIDEVLADLLSWRTSAGKPFFPRVQLNFKFGREKEPDLPTLERMMLSFPDVRFIVSYNDANAHFLEQLYRRKKVTFDCLFDSSFGKAVEPQSLLEPAFPNVLQGWAGGISAENVQKRLQEIERLVPTNAEVFIDAEGALKGEDRHLSLEKCHTYLHNAFAYTNQL